MAIFAHTNCHVTINSVDLSDHVVSAEWNETTDTVESVAMGGTDVVVKPTFQRGSFSVEFQQDYAASEVYATIAAALDANVSIAVEYRADAASVSATNPTMQTNCVVTEFAQGGGIGEIATTAFTWPFDGTGVTRAVA
jgi:hypothetical protein